MQGEVDLLKLEGIYTSARERWEKTALSSRKSHLQGLTLYPASYEDNEQHGETQTSV